MTQSVHEEFSNTTPMTIVEGRTIKPGRENDFYAWVHRALATSERYPGSQSVTILTLGKEQSAVRYIVHSFVDETTGRAWMQSGERAKLMQDAAAFSTPYTQTSSGPEAWFTLPDVTNVAPPKWKLFLVTIPSAYVASTAVVLILNTFLRGWPFLLTNVIATVFLSFVLTYIGLPVSTRILHSWLYPQEKHSM